ncbi:MAG: hypothetical protein EPN97_16415 [Alphaproteobacteria bacterium]|nr:MAG: hypothetical protein EPN97_16415 [Alphaproteobacteria bacterium]
MAQDKGRKRTFGQKAARFIRRLTLCTAFAAAAGAGYNFYGTQQDITARVTSVEPAPSGSIIHTDRGNFVNTPTIAHEKTPDDVLSIAGKMKPGATVKLHVYGIEKIGQFRFENFGYYRNITEAIMIREPRAVIPPDPALVVPPGMVNAEGIDKEDPALPQACAANDDLAGISARTPRLARDLDIMRQLPLTGTGVYEMLKDPANNIESCLFPVPPKSGATSTYLNKHARIARGMGTSVVFHEYFHAQQSVNEGGKNMYTLTEGDAVVANLLKEASAVAYELAARQEAENVGLKFYEPPPYIEKWQEGDIVHTQTWTKISPASAPATRAAFKEAYNASFEANAGMQDDAREAAALQAGGRAVVSHLLAGKNADWNSTYTDLVIGNVKGRYFRKSGTGDAYIARRDEVFKSQGGISSGINFVPEEYLGPDAKPAIEKAFKDVGFVWKTDAAPSTPAPPALPPKPSS